MATIIDLIIYAHDGRGLGHVSRSVAIGLAVRRMYPRMSVLLLTGSSAVAELVGTGDLDWIKLPSYKTRITDGKSSGAMGPSNIEDKLLGELRAENIRHIINSYKPKVFLADHTPQGKHKELIPSHMVSPETRRVLGVRAVVGDVDKVWSDFSADVFKGTYQDILWYGDSSVTGESEIEALVRRYNVRPYETGYVSRFAEMDKISPVAGSSRKQAGIISVPWSGEGTMSVLEKLSAALRNMDSSFGEWKIFMNLRESGAERAQQCFAGLDNVCFSPVGPDFFSELACSRSSVIYGGYNSLTDVMACGVPSVVLLRGMKDGEQEEHAAVLARNSGSIVDVYPEQDLSSSDLETSLRKCLENGTQPERINLDGAENAARYLAGLAGIEEGE